jgi:hypothetical protein
VPESHRTPTGSIYTGAFASLTEDVIREDILGSIWDQTGTNGNFQFVVGRQLKALISGWTIYTPDVSSNTVVRTFQQDDATVIRAAVDRLEGDFGTLELRTSPWLHRELDLTVTANQNRAQRSGIIFDADALEVRYNSKPNFRAFEDQGGGPRGLVEAIWCLCVKSPKGLGKIDPAS